MINLSSLLSMEFVTEVESILSPLVMSDGLLERGVNSVSRSVFTPSFALSCSKGRILMVGSSSTRDCTCNRK